MRDEVTAINNWYVRVHRDLPWRQAGVSPWGVMVSEFMLQQTPATRVIGPWREWLHRWPTPGALANEPSGAAVAAWGRLGYPRRALRLHAAATAIAKQGGEVPTRIDALLALPGVGPYTAAAIASFAFGQRHVVLDTNVRRVLARLDAGVEYPPPTPTKAEYREAERWLPDEPPLAATWAAASMELGAVVCVARSPRCESCPVIGFCAWRAAGYPAHEGPPRRGQPWHGTDRQCRGHLLDIVRTSGSVEVDLLIASWHSADQARRCLESLTADGLVHLGEAGVTL